MTNNEQPINDTDELINEFIEDCVKEYTDKIFVTDQELNVTQSWVNRTEIGQEHHYHDHPNSILSGVFFLKSGSPIKFLNNRNCSFQLEHKKNVNPYNQYNHYNQHNHYNQYE